MRRAWISSSSPWASTSDQKGGRATAVMYRCNVTGGGDVRRPGLSSKPIDNIGKGGRDLGIWTATGRCPVIAIIGGGFSGTLTAVQLLRRAEAGTRILLIERSGDFGPGVAYATPDDRHALNVPAARMSALPGEPGDLVAW